MALSISTSYTIEQSSAATNLTISPAPFLLRWMKLLRLSDRTKMASVTVVFRLIRFTAMRDTSMILKVMMDCTTWLRTRGVWKIANSSLATRLCCTSTEPKRTLSRRQGGEGDGWELPMPACGWCTVIPSSIWWWGCRQFSFLETRRISGTNPDRLATAIWHTAATRLGMIVVTRSFGTFLIKLLFTIFIYLIVLIK